MIIVYQSLESTGNVDDTMGTSLGGNNYKRDVHKPNNIKKMYPNIKNNGITVKIPTFEEIDKNKIDSNKQYIQALDKVYSHEYKNHQIKFATREESDSLSVGYKNKPDNLTLSNFLYGVIETIKSSTRQRTLISGSDMNHACREPDIIVLGEVYASSMLNQEINGYKVIHGINPTGDSRHRFTVLRRALMSPKDYDDIEIFPFNDTNPNTYKDENAICMMLRIKGWLAAFVHTPNNLYKDDKETNKKKISNYIKNNVTRVNAKAEEFDLLIGDTNQTSNTLTEEAMSKHIAESFALYNFAPFEVVILINLVGIHSTQLQSIPVNNNSLLNNDYMKISFINEEIKTIKGKLAEKEKELAKQIELDKTAFNKETESAKKIDLARKIDLAERIKETAAKLNAKLLLKTWQSSITNGKQDVVGFGYQVFQIKGTNSGYTKHFDIACTHQATIKIFNSQVVGNPSEDIKPVFIFHGLTDKFIPDECRTINNQSITINKKAYAYSDHNGIIVEVLQGKWEHENAKKSKAVAIHRQVMPEIHNTLAKHDAMDILPDFTNEVFDVIDKQPNALNNVPETIKEQINNKRCIKCGGVFRRGDTSLKTAQGAIHEQCPPSKQVVLYNPYGRNLHGKSKKNKKLNNDDNN